MSWELDHTVLICFSVIVTYIRILSPQGQNKFAFGAPGCWTWKGKNIVT